MSQEQPNNPLHDLTLKVILEELVNRRGWQSLSKQIDIRCFSNEPSIKSSLKFLRKTPWAREKVEQLFLRDREYIDRERKRSRRKNFREAQITHPEEGDSVPTTLDLGSTQRTTVGDPPPGE
jgi:uncharacterized protein (DUF2132 family)